MKTANCTAEDDLMNTRARGMCDVAIDAVEREAVALRENRVADAAMYREIADRARAVAAKEHKLNRKTTERNKDLSTAAFTIACVVLGFALMTILSGCTAMVSGRPTPPPKFEVPPLEVGAWVGSAVVSGRGHEDVGDVGAYPVVGIGVASGNGEFFAEYGGASGENIDAGALGIFDLEADVLRVGVGMRVLERRSLGLDWTLGLGACLTVVDGTASDGTLSRDVNEGGLGAYAALQATRGPLLLRLSYVDGPEIEVGGEDIQAGGLTLAAGIRGSL